jgi:hypothetical protein
MGILQLRDTAILIGYTPEGQCTYSAQMPLDEYWDGEHPWDSGTTVQSLRLEKVRGYLFDASGELLQEFESIFNLDSGIYKSGWARHADGTFLQDGA